MTSDPSFPYTTPRQLRQALKDRLTTVAQHGGRHRLDELQRQLAYDRALARLFTSTDASSWVLKGGGALLARLPDARHSRDLDMFFDAATVAPADAVTALRQALRDAVPQAFETLCSKPSGRCARSARVSGVPRRTRR